MQRALSIEDFTTLQASLIVPVIVGDIMLGTEPLDDEARYALHDSLCEIDPDSALLAIALAAQHVAAPFVGKIPVAIAVKYESEKLLQEYGPEWLANYQGGPVNEDVLFELLQTLPEDLEALADLLDAMSTSIVHDETARALCEILSVQARAHMDVADYIIGELEAALYGTPQEAMEPAHTNTNNVIEFPLGRTRH
jgi:hypothetical protein